MLMFFINSYMAAFCSSLQFWHLMRVTLTEDWPVFVCLWAKCQRICCACLSCQYSVYRMEVDTASGLSESAWCLCQVTDPAGQVAECWSMDLTSVYLTCQSNKPVTLDSLKQKQNSNTHKIVFMCYSVPSLTVSPLWAVIFGPCTHLYALKLVDTCQVGRTQPRRGPPATCQKPSPVSSWY